MVRALPAWMKAVGRCRLIGQAMSTFRSQALNFPVAESIKICPWWGLAFNLRGPHIIIISRSSSLPRLPKTKNESHVRSINGWLNEGGSRWGRLNLGCTYIAACDIINAFCLLIYMNAPVSLILKLLERDAKMAPGAHTSPLLTLPLELRRQIYEQLLSPDPNRVHTLYHDREGREAFTGIDPKILRVNKQIHFEASPLLYENNKFLIHLATPVIHQCTGGNYPDRIVDPADLFRADPTDESGKSDSIAQDASSIPPATESRRSRRRPQCSTTGVIYPHCFQRLRHINLITSRNAIWGQSMLGGYFSHTGERIWKILKVLNDEQTTAAPVKKQLKFTIRKDWLSYGAELKGGQNDIDEQTKPIVGLMKALQRRTGADIEVEEGEFSKSLGEVQMEEAEIDIWEEVLLADKIEDTNAFQMKHRRR